MHQSHGRRVLGAFAVTGLLFIPAFSAGAQTPADNTKVNKGDRAKGATTADQQTENAGDREITQKIRRALLDCNGIRFWRDRLALVQVRLH